MNIFFLSDNVLEAVQFLCDKHVVKMTTETVQILSTAVYLTTGNQGCYKPTHKHHPCVLWATKSSANFSWLLDYAYSLGTEYTKRYGKSHKAIEQLSQMDVTDCLTALPKKEFENPPQCMPDKYKTADTIEAYRAYYKGEKATFATWKFTKQPDWW